jgi:hypothetical protein
MYILINKDIDKEQNRTNVIKLFTSVIYENVHPLQTFKG